MRTPSQGICILDRNYTEVPEATEGKPHFEFFPLLTLFPLCRSEPYWIVRKRRVPTD